MALLRQARALAPLGRTAAPAAARSLSVTAVQQERSYGGLHDDDRIFQNLYGRHDWGLKGAMARVRSHCQPSQDACSIRPQPVLPASSARPRVPW